MMTREHRDTVPEESGPTCPDRRAALEDMPMRRYSRPAPLSARAGEREELLTLLEKQNGLLWELLCAVNGLAAARMARGDCRD